MSSAAQSSADVQHLRDWIGKQPHLPRVEDNAFLERFLLGCKSSLPRCKEVLDMYYTVRTGVPELFKNRDPTCQEIRGIAKTAYSVTLQQLTPVGYHVTLLGLLDTNPNSFSHTSFMKRLFMQMDMFLATTMCAGAVIVTDLAGASFGHMGGLTPSLLKKFLLCAQDAWPGRIKEFHIMNGPPLTGKIIEVAKRYVKEKTIVKIHVHKGPETLYDFIPREMLPAEYGGEAGSINDLNGKFCVDRKEIMVVTPQLDTGVRIIKCGYRYLKNFFNCSMLDRDSWSCQENGLLKKKGNWLIFQSDKNKVLIF